LQHALVLKDPQRAIADLNLGWETLGPNTIGVSPHWFSFDPPYKVHSITLVNSTLLDPR
jgi:hypothetical protein